MNKKLFDNPASRLMKVLESIIDHDPIKTGVKVPHMWGEVFCISATPDSYYRSYSKLFKLNFDAFSAVTHIYTSPAQVETHTAWFKQIDAIFKKCSHYDANWNSLVAEIKKPHILRQLQVASDLLKPHVLTVNISNERLDDLITQFTEIKKELDLDKTIPVLVKRHIVSVLNDLIENLKNITLYGTESFIQSIMSSKAVIEKVEKSGTGGEIIDKLNQFLIAAACVVSIGAGTPTALENYNEFFELLEDKSSEVLQIEKNTIEHNSDDGPV